MNRAVTCAVLAMVAAGCSGGGPTGSYIYPTAIIGVPLRSEDEGEAIYALLARFGAQRGAGRVYRPADEPFFRDQGYGIYPEMTYYRPPLATMDFSLSVLWWRPHCMLVRLSEQSGIWTPQSLAAFEELKQELSRTTDSRAQVFVRPKALQYWPRREKDPERPPRLEEFCVRMGLPDPREDPRMRPPPTPESLRSIVQ